MKFLEINDSTTPCPYLSGREFTAENFLAPNLDGDELDRLLAKGFRHFGTYYFRPVCESCFNCVPLRVRMREFRPSRSARRLFNTNRDLRVTIGAPSPGARPFDLYRKHQLRFDHRSSGTYEHFVRSFFTPTFGNTQLSVYSSSRLISVLHLDVTGTSMSAVYCYYDTDYTKRSLGTFSIFKALDWGRRAGISFFYLGYSVDGNRHMDYKTRFRPNEFLSDGEWISLFDENGEKGNSERFARGFRGIDHRQREPFTKILLQP